MNRDRKASKRLYGGLAMLFLIVGAAAVWLVFELRSHPPDDVSGVPTERLEMRKRSVAQDLLKAVLSEKAGALLRDPGSPVGGNPDGDVTLVEFADYNCPYCRRVAPLVAEMESADPGLRIVYKEIPILGADSVFAAKAALAAHE